MCIMFYSIVLYRGFPSFDGYKKVFVHWSASCGKQTVAWWVQWDTLIFVKNIDLI